MAVIHHCELKKNPKKSKQKQLKVAVILTSVMRRSWFPFCSQLLICNVHEIFHILSVHFKMGTTLHARIHTHTHTRTEVFSEKEQNAKVKGLTAVKPFSRHKPSLCVCLCEQWHRQKTQRQQGEHMAQLRTLVSYCHLLAMWGTARPSPTQGLCSRDGREKRRNQCGEGAGGIKCHRGKKLSKINKQQ